MHAKRMRKQDEPRSKRKVAMTPEEFRGLATSLTKCAENFAAVADQMEKYQIPRVHIEGLAMAEAGIVWLRKLHAAVSGALAEYE